MLKLYFKHCVLSSVRAIVKSCSILSFFEQEKRKCTFTLNLLVHISCYFCFYFNNLACISSVGSIKPLQLVNDLAIADDSSLWECPHIRAYTSCIFVKPLCLITSGSASLAGEMSCC